MLRIPKLWSSVHAPSQEMRAFFAQGNKYSLEQLKKALTRKALKTEQ